MIVALPGLFSYLSIKSIKVWLSKLYKPCSEYAKLLESSTEARTRGVLHTTTVFNPLLKAK